MSMHDYILKMKAVADSLSATGQMISNEDLILYILGGLSQEYDFVVVNLTSRCDELSLQELQFLLQSQEMRLEQLNSAANLDLNSPVANLVVNSRRNNRSSYQQSNQQNYYDGQNSQGGRGNFRGRAHGCGGRGYSNRGDTEPQVCQLCDRVGHVASRCYHRFDITFQRPQQNSRANYSRPSNGSQQLVFVAQSSYNASPSTVNDPAWYVDSGATNHITADLNNLALRTDYKGKEKFLVGNGQSLHISHVGSYAFNFKVSAKPFVHDKVLCVLPLQKTYLAFLKLQKIMTLLLNFTLILVYLRTKLRGRCFFKGSLNMGPIN